LQASMQELWQC